MDLTNRLYYDNSYLKVFEARVEACREKEGRFEIALDQSAFYPTSGGQPYDTGTICFAGGETRVSDVWADADGTIWHRVDRPIPEETYVRGRIDRARRFDHMQQHGGEHMLAGAIHHLLGGGTIGLHLGRDISSIDVTLPGGRTHLTKQEILMLEEQVNTWIQQDDPVKCYFPEPDELASLPLRKPPTVAQSIRIVAFGDYEMVPCGGTHPSSAGQVGLLKILSVAPAKGKARVTFVCGMRAFRYFCRCQEAAEQSGRLLSCPVDELPGAVERMQAQALETEKKLAQTLEKVYLEKMRACEENGVVCLWIGDGDCDALRAAAAAYIRQSGKQVLCGAGGRLIFARSRDAAGDMGALMRSAARGGGKSDFAAGAGDEEALWRARKTLEGK